MRGLVAENLTKSFGGIAVANDIDLHLPPGARKALIGPNGAGKSALVDLLAGASRPDSGRIEFNGRDVTRLGQPARVRAGIVKTFQISTLFRELTVRENLRLPLLEREGRALRWLRRADGFSDIEDEIDNLLFDFGIAPIADVPVRTLGYGQQRLLEMAMTLALRPRLLLMDEPAAGVPASDRYMIREAIAGLPAELSLLLVEHDIDMADDAAETVIVVVNGLVMVEGPPDEIRLDDTVRALYRGRPS